MMTARYQKRKETENELKRIAVYSALLFFLAVAESSFFGAVDILPSTPDLILGAISVIAVTDKRETAAITAIVGGVMADAICGVGIYLSPIFYFAVALILHPLAKKMLKSYLSWLAIFPSALLMRALYTFGRAYLFGGGLGASEILRYAVLPEAICTAVFSLCLYPLIMLLARIVRGRREMR
ncbi:MAG: hypothetical protein IJ011_04560 [Clostridia bacterium]|nr:hypothetical protein [Clostridia bacterium]